jgi:ribosomal protein S6--L-glutamate ligase
MSRTLAGASIELCVEERAGRPAVNPVMQRFLDAMTGRGARVAVRVAEREAACPGTPGPRADLVLLKTTTPLALGRAASAEHFGQRHANSATATVRAADKAAVLGALAARGVAVPETYLVAPGLPATDLPADAERDAAWVVKPVRGIHGAGVTTHPALDRALADCSARPAAPGESLLLQRHVGGDAPDVKVYVAGTAVHAGRKRFSRSSFELDEVEPVTLDEASDAAVRACGPALGLELYGVDIRYDALGRPLVIDVNPFPGYRGFPAAVDSLLDTVERAVAA